MDMLQQALGVLHILELQYPENTIKLVFGVYEDSKHEWWGEYYKEVWVDECETIEEFSGLDELRAVIRKYIKGV